jgi:hypothetical protein
VLLDELNKYAPREGWSPIGDVLLSLSSAVPGDERRESRARRYDQLPRKPPEPQHEAQNVLIKYAVISTVRTVRRS